MAACSLLRRTCAAWRAWACHATAYAPIPMADQISTTPSAVIDHFLSGAMGPNSLPAAPARDGIPSSRPERLAASVPAATCFPLPDPPKISWCFLFGASADTPAVGMVRLRETAAGTAPRPEGE